MFIKDICSDYNIPPKPITKEAIQLLQSQNWSGNVRELRNVVERLIILSEEKITGADVQMFVAPSGGGVVTNNSLYDRFEVLQDFKEHTEKMFIQHKLEQNSWNVKRTSEILGIQRSHLHNKIVKYELKRD